MFIRSGKIRGEVSFSVRSGKVRECQGNLQRLSRVSTPAGKAGNAREAVQ